MTLNDPYSSKFAADGEDILISGLSNSVTFELRVNGNTVVSETYNYDADGQVRIGGIADMVSRCLYGTLAVASQPNAKATVDFLIDGATIYSHTLYSSRLKNPYDPAGQKAVMAVARRTTCPPGSPFYLTFTGSTAASLRRADGSEIRSVSVGSPGTVYTQDCDPGTLFGSSWEQGSHVTFGGEMTVRIGSAACEDNVAVRFLNRYDVMESLVAAYMVEKPTVEDDTSVMFGRRTRFDTKSSTEYTLSSGRLDYPEQMDTWQDLLTSRKAQVMFNGQWTDIVVTKANYTRLRRQFYSSQAEVSFQTANPLLTL